MNKQIKSKKKRKLKHIQIDHPPHKLRWLDVILRPFPKAVIDISNEYGELVISNIQLTLTTPADWQNMKFFYTKLLPLLAPPEVKQSKQEPPKKKGGGYVG